MAHPDAQDPQPTPFGRYVLLQRLGAGSMSELWKARSLAAPERLVVIKRIARSLAQDDAFLAMFLDEARINVQLVHTNILQMYDLGRVGEDFYAALEYVPGVTAQDLLARGPSPVAAACLVVARAAAGLDHAHRFVDPRGQALDVVHRNVTPQAVVVGFDGQVKVTDFAIARARRRATVTEPGVLKGVIGYLSPELARGEAIDQRADVFGLGVVLHELLTGERLVQGKSEYDALLKTREARFAPPSQANPQVPPALDAVVLRALASDPASRYGYASELAQALRPFCQAGGAAFDGAALGAFVAGAFAAQWARSRALDAAHASR